MAPAKLRWRALPAGRAPFSSALPFARSLRLALLAVLACSAAATAAGRGPSSLAIKPQLRPKTGQSLLMALKALNDDFENRDTVVNEQVNITLACGKQYNMYKLKKVADDSTGKRVKVPEVLTDDEYGDSLYLSGGKGRTINIQAAAKCGDDPALRPIIFTGPVTVDSFSDGVTPLIYLDGVNARINLRNVIVDGNSVRPCLSLYSSQAALSMSGVCLKNCAAPDA